MQKVLQLLEKILSLPNEGQLFVISILALLLAGFALYVVLVVLSGKGGKS